MKSSINVLPISFCSDLLLFTGCKEDETEPDLTIKLLSLKKWKWTLNDPNPASNPDGKIKYLPNRDCSLNDEISFSGNGQYTITRGKVSCDPNEMSPYITEFKIDLINKKFSAGGDEYIIAELTGNVFKSYSASHFQGFDYDVSVMVR